MMKNRMQSLTALASPKDGPDRRTPLLGSIILVSFFLRREDGTKVLHTRPKKSSAPRRTPKFPKLLVRFHPAKLRLVFLPARDPEQLTATIASPGLMWGTCWSFDDEL